ncbi:hypothetical protein RYX36_023043, partial [Vicia faba]
MGWLTKLLKGSNHKYSGRGYDGKFGHDKDLNDHDDFVTHYTSEDDSEFEFEDDELCPLDDKEDDHVGNVKRGEDDHVGDVKQEEYDHISKIHQDEDTNLDEVQLENDEQLARAIQESLAIGSPPRSHIDLYFNLSQTFSLPYI